MHNKAHYLSFFWSLWRTMAHINSFYKSQAKFVLLGELATPTIYGWGPQNAKRHKTTADKSSCTATPEVALFWSYFSLSCLQKPKETGSMQMLKEDNEHWEQLGFTLNTYGMDLSKYQFDD